MRTLLEDLSWHFELPQTVTEREVMENDSHRDRQSLPTHGQEERRDIFHGSTAFIVEGLQGLPQPCIYFQNAQRHGERVSSQVQCGCVCGFGETP